MDADKFENTFDELTRLNNTDGPNRNIFEPKFQAREQMLTLLSTLTKTHEQTPTLLSEVQIARCYQFVGNTMIETEEVADGFKNLYRSHRLIAETIKKNVIPAKEIETETDELNGILKLNEPLVNSSTGFEYAREYLSILNTLGLHMCSTDSLQKMNDAKKILLLAEQCYKDWDKYFTPIGVRMSEVPMTEDGLIKEDCKQRDLCAIRHRMDSLYTSTLFFLAQAYTQTDALIASKYAHLTMVHQLETRSEFSKKMWAENALHLSGFYSGQYQYGKALHCLLAGKHMMPTEPDDEETTGKVVWAFGRYHLSRLRYYSSLPNTHESFVDDTEAWFIPFPLPLPPVEKLAHIKTFGDARDEFKKANADFVVASKYYAFDGQCTDHILILKDISELYKCLISFEEDVERQAAMHARRLALLESIPGQLNPQAYLTNIRQLQFDIADIANDIFDVRLRQKKAEGQLGKPLSDRQMNKLNDAAQTKYREFLSTFKEEKQAEEVRLAVFRAKMRICSLLTKKYYKEPKDEYDAISNAIKEYADVIVFAELNPMGDEVKDELDLAKQMHSLLPGKKRSIAQAFQH